MKKFAVVLSGCGFEDGAEITESVSTLIALSEAQIQYEIFAPDESFQALNSLTGEKLDSRSALVEAARIARGKIHDLKNLKASHYDAVIFPGGFGAVSILCTFAAKGAACEVHPEAERVIREFQKDDKPIGAFCIAPALIAKVLGPQNVTVTIGEEGPTADEIRKTGAEHVPCAVNDYVSDRETKVVTSPAYMYDDAKPFEVFTGIRKAIREIAEMS